VQDECLCDKFGRENQMSLFQSLKEKLFLFLKMVEAPGNISSKCRDISVIWKVTLVQNVCNMY
jgi:hypothetical protein